MKIRNFTIIAHIDHGKSTLSDRLIEFTNTLEKRKMKDQVLDSMDLERERGITIKMQPVTMEYKGYHLNLIDTPGHIDFSYEVSRALKAVEGSILLVDATQGIQAQTMSVLEMARSFGHTIIPVVNKIDSPNARVKEVKEEVSKLLSCSVGDVLETSGKTGAGVPELLEEVISKVPTPKEEGGVFKSLVFDFEYSNHQGMIVYIRVLSGSVKKKDNLSFVMAGKKFLANEVGVFKPAPLPVGSLSCGEIGYIVTGIKEAGIASVGDTVSSSDYRGEALSGYEKPSPMVWASIYPESQDDFDELKRALLKLELTDSSLTFEEESSGILGRGFRCGFLGMLHLEIATERLKREFGLTIVVTIPTITYDIKRKNGKVETVYSPIAFPDEGDVLEVMEPWVSVKILLPTDYLEMVMPIFYEHECNVVETDTFGDDRISLSVEMPLRELMRRFFERIKTASSGYASISYTLLPNKKADVTRMDLLVAEEPVPAFSRIVAKHSIQEEGEKAVEKLHKILPRQQFATKIQARALGRIISSETLKPLRKDVTGHLYGGDITRKRKLWEKQKKGKKRLAETGTVHIPTDVFMKMIQ
ncbi:MAG: translation elongation factor 4 [Candidatus Pacebacteria bacterium]|nr:translation elongation factor 4 [Candidatus Paceibacterota bacterium]